MTQSDQWHPSDIDAAAAAGGDDGEAGAKRRTRSPAPAEQTPAQEPPAAAVDKQPARPVGSGIMTLDRDSGSRESAQIKQDSAPPLDVLQRLRETTERCIKGYESWRAGNDGESELIDSLHEQRKVLARIEIELAASHADESAQRPIPIPLHRAHKHGSDSRR